MERDYGKEIDEMRREIEKLKGKKAKKRKGPTAGVIAFVKATGNGPPNIDELAESMEVPPGVDEVARSAVDQGFISGVLRTRGIYQSPAAECFMWSQEMEADRVLDTDDESVEKVLSAVADRTRLRMLKAILRTPSTVADLVQSLGFATTGKAYHHLNVLESADFVSKDDGGKYHFRGHRVAGFLSALWAVANTIDDQYTTPVETKSQRPM